MTEILKYQFSNQYKELLDLVKNPEGEFLYKNHRPGKWSIHENITHLGRYQEIFEDRIKKMLVADVPQFSRYNAEQDPGFIKWREKETNEVIGSFTQKRMDLIEWIKHLTDQQMERKGIHPKLGSMMITEWFHFFLLHESHHIYTVFWLIHEFKVK